MLIKVNFRWEIVKNILTYLKCIGKFQLIEVKFSYFRNVSISKNIFQKASVFYISTSFCYRGSIVLYTGTEKQSFTIWGQWTFPFSPNTEKSGMKEVFNIFEFFILSMEKSIHIYINHTFLKNNKIWNAFMLVTIGHASIYQINPT